MTGDVEPVRSILNRIAAEQPAPALIHGYEIELWPDGALDELVKRGLLIETTRATSAECTGCEWRCSKAVEARPLPDKSLRAFIWCDEEPGHGRVPVALERLRRFQASLRTAAKFAVDCLGLPTDAQAAQMDRIEIATVRGRNGPREVSVIRDAKQILLRVGDEVEELAGIIAWDGTDIRIDQALFGRLVDRKLKPPSRASRDGDDIQRSMEDVTTATQERDAQIIRLGRKLKTPHRTWQDVAAEIAQLPFVASPGDGLRRISGETVRRILADRDKK